MSATESFTIKLPGGRFMRRLRYFAAEEGESIEQYVARATALVVNNDHEDPPGWPMDRDADTRTVLNAPRGRKAMRRKEGAMPEPIETFVVHIPSGIAKEIRRVARKTRQTVEAAI